MKKILIALLSLAMLFSFVACDNSSNTPAGDEEQTQGPVISDTQIATIASAISSMVEGSTSGTNFSTIAINALSGNLLDTNGDPIKDVTISDDYTTISKVIKLEDGIEGYTDDTQVTITLKGVDITPNAAATENKVIRLSGYEYKFSTTGIDSNENVAVLEGTISGTVVGDGSTAGIVTVTRSTGKVSQVAVTAPSKYLLPEKADGIKVTLGDEPVDSAKLFALLNNKVPASSAKAETYASYIKAQQLAAKKLMNSVVADVILGDDFTTIITDFIAPNVGTLTYADGTASTKATASVSYTVPAAANYILAGDSQSVKVNQLTVEFAAAAAGATSGEFVPKTFTISGTFAVYGDTTGTKLSEDFEEIVLEGVTGTITSSDAKITATGGKFTAFTGTNTYAVAPATDKGSVTADILTEAGPALVGTGADTKLAPLGEVVLEYPTTESLV